MKKQYVIVLLILVSLFGCYWYMWYSGSSKEGLQKKMTARLFPLEGLLLKPSVEGSSCRASGQQLTDAQIETLNSEDFFAKIIEENPECIRLFRKENVLYMGFDEGDGDWDEHILRSGETDNMIFDYHTSVNKTRFRILMDDGQINDKVSMGITYRTRFMKGETYKVLLNFKGFTQAYGNITEDIPLDLTIAYVEKLQD